MAQGFKNVSKILVIFKMSEYKKTLEYIHSLGMFSHSAGLGRITELLEVLGNPQKNLSGLHIAGTNGKGSTAAMTAKALQCAGYKTGLFVSPFILEFRERIQINGEFITEAPLIRLAEKVKNTGIAVTEFEFITAVAFLYFSECKCDVCVIETGLGGRLDATNTLPAEFLPVITKIGLDHTAILGGTVEEIAAEKCGIIKGDIAVTCVGQNNGALGVIKSKARRLIVPDEFQLRCVSCDILGNRFVYKGRRYETALGGEYQVQNALTAIEALYEFAPSIPYEAVFEGLKNAAFPARLEVVSQTPLTVLDGAHNPDGAEALCEAMRPFEGKITAIVGMMRDKSVDEFLRLTLPMCKDVVAVRAADNKRSLSAEEMADAAGKYCKNIITAQSTAQAVIKARSLSKDNPIFIFGSLYLAADIRNEFI